MNQSTGTPGYGATLSYATITAGTPGTYTTIAQTVDVNTPMEEIGDINITNNSSPNNTKEYIAGMIEPGDVEFDLVYMHGHQTVFALLGTTLSWKETFTDGTSVVFPGYMKSRGIESKTEDGALTAKIKIKVTGAVTYSYTAPS